MSEQTYESGTIATWTRKDGVLLVSIRRSDGWAFASPLKVAENVTDDYIATRTNLQILDPVQIDWRKKFEQQSSRLEVIKQQLTTTTEELRARYADLHKAEQQVTVAENAAKDIERLKDAEIAKLKSQIEDITNENLKKLRTGQVAEDKVERAINLIVDRIMNMER